ncbi:MAG: hypothetical protein JNJ80_25825 [Gemmatimonadetes bacterium]|nr:hypothetical protein [Gemmatimonadota bacterium]
MPVFLRALMTCAAAAMVIGCDAAGPSWGPVDLEILDYSPFAVGEEIPPPSVLIERQGVTVMGTFATSQLGLNVEGGHRFPGPGQLTLEIRALPGSGGRLDTISKFRFRAHIRSIPAGQYRFRLVYHVLDSRDVRFTTLDTTIVVH